MIFSAETHCIAEAQLLQPEPNGTLARQPRHGGVFEKPGTSSKEQGAFFEHARVMEVPLM